MAQAQGIITVGKNELLEKPEGIVSTPLNLFYTDEYGNRHIISITTRSHGAFKNHSVFLTGKVTWVVGRDPSNCGLLLPIKKRKGWKYKKLMWEVDGGGLDVGKIPKFPVGFEKVFGDFTEDSPFSQLCIPLSDEYVWVVGRINGKLHLIPQYSDEGVSIQYPNYGIKGKDPDDVQRVPHGQRVRLNSRAGTMSPLAPRVTSCEESQKFNGLGWYIEPGTIPYMGIDNRNRLVLALTNRTHNTTPNYDLPMINLVDHYDYVPEEKAKKERKTPVILRMPIPTYISSDQAKVEIEGGVVKLKGFVNRESETLNAQESEQVCEAREEG